MSYTESFSLALAITPEELNTLVIVCLNFNFIRLLGTEWRNGDVDSFLHSMKYIFLQTDVFVKN